MTNALALFIAIAVLALGWAHHLSGQRRKLVAFAFEVANMATDAAIAGTKISGAKLAEMTRAVLRRVGEL